MSIRRTIKLLGNSATMLLANADNDIIHSFEHLRDNVFDQCGSVVTIM